MENYTLKVKKLDVLNYVIVIIIKKLRAENIFSLSDKKI